jgi:hypothetical protein
MASAKLLSLSLALGLLSTAGCARSTSSTDATASPNKSNGAPNPDPRVGLRAGLMDAQEAMWNVRVVS